MEMFGLKAEWFWQNVVGRVLLGTVPGMDMVFLAADDPAMQNFNPDGPQDIIGLFSAAHTWQAFGQIETWIGAVAGIAMIFGAIWFRKVRDEG
jgi:ABC-2 type transport system permease protein